MIYIRNLISTIYIAKIKVVILTATILLLDETGCGGKRAGTRRIQGFSKEIYFKLKSISNTGTIKYE